jgi:hypothetical protein
MVLVRTCSNKAFSGNIREVRPAVAELAFEERPNEPNLFFTADKTDPDCYNLSLYMDFTYPFWGSVRNTVLHKTIGARQRGFFVATCYPYLTGIYGHHGKTQIVGRMIFNTHVVAIGYTVSSTHTK